MRHLPLLIFVSLFLAACGGAGDEGTTLTYGGSGRYAFPLAGNPADMTWTEFHWDGSNAVDIEAGPHMAHGSQAYSDFAGLAVVAVITGTVRLADNESGGRALILQGQDGYSYYYAHLSEQWVTAGQAVGRGEALGRVGNSGRWTQYIEPHLHFSINSPAAATGHQNPDTNAAAWLQTHFGLGWRANTAADYPPDTAADWPLDVPAEVTRPFTVLPNNNPDLASIDIRATGTHAGPLPVYATLTGEVNIHRGTSLGLRVQITNRPTDETVVYSFLREATVADGAVVQRGELVGYVEPDVNLNYMLFVNGLLRDGETRLGAR